ncbi:Rossmann-like and DUF2520 domain-containing protein [Frankia sp. Cas4]|uniref:Rossmann-like and DUF2520 domain-containing protein n=2 Tax=Frankia TaxID=1854 RepID=UPI002AD271EC|nr:Rossmann-like and DUF2520 domain-containing protein [Frankia sp. Cas4]
MAAVRLGVGKAWWEHGPMAGDRGFVGGRTAQTVIVTPALRIGIVGVGRAGTALGTALAGAGHPVVAVHARSVAGRARARATFPAASSATPAEVADASDVTFLTVSDDVISGVLADIVNAGVLRAGQIVAHASGRHGVGILEPARDCGASRAAVHPIMTLSGTAADAGLLSGASFGVTADPAAEQVVCTLVTEIGGRVVFVPERVRTAYHAAVVLGSNYLATLVTATLALLDELGVHEGADALAPLLRQSLDNAIERGPAALTGPVRRGDAGTVRAHLDALGAVDPAAMSVYAALASLTLNQLEQAGLAERERSEAVREVLSASAMHTVL